MIFTNSDLWQNESAIHNFKIIDYAWISIMLFDFVLKVINKILLIADVSFAELFSVVNNDISILNQKIIFDQ